MSFLRVTTGLSAVNIPDLGFTIPPSSTVILSNQFNVLALLNSADLEALIIATTLSVAIDYGTGFVAIPSTDYTNRDAIGAYMNIYEITNENGNERLVQGGDASATTQLHHHDTRYFTKTQTQNTAVGADGAGLIGFDSTAPWTLGAALTVRAALLQLQTAIQTTTLDTVYTQDTDGILNVNGTTKPLDFRSNNANEIRVSRTNGVDLQTLIRAAVATNQLQLGSAAVGALGAMSVRVLTNLIVDGDITYTGSITDTTVNELNVANANIRLRDGATAIAAADARVLVERGTSGADAALHWNSVTNRWRAGLEATEQTLALLEASDLVTGVWTFTGGAATDPSLYLTDKAAAPTTNLGAATQIPIVMILNTPAYQDKARAKFLSMYRHSYRYSGRDAGANTQEYARAGLMTSNQAGIRLLKNMTLIGISVQTAAAATWNVQVRRNNVLTNLATFALTAVTGAQASNYNVDFNQGDSVEVFIDGTGINRPLVNLEFAERF